MASFPYDFSLSNVVSGAIDFLGGTFKVMLVTAAYVPNKATDATRANVTNEVVGAGYAAGGNPTVVTVTQNFGADQFNVTFAVTNWPASTITARAAVIYQANGGLPSGDPLVAYVDFGANKTSAGGNFGVTFDTPYRYQN